MKICKTFFQCGYSDSDNSCEFCLSFNDNQCKLDSVDFVDETICDYCKNKESTKCLICCNFKDN